MTISDVVAASGVSAKMIRYYERRGLMGPAQRTASGHWVYSAHDIHILDFIRRSRELGLSVAEIAALLALSRNRQLASEDVKALAVKQSRLLSADASTLAALVQALMELAADWQRQDGEDYPMSRGHFVDSQSAAQTASYQRPSIRGH